jgi:His-Xaa-Ser system protein HxsD
MNQIRTSMEVRVDLRIYPLITAQKAAARLSSQFAIELAQDNESTLLVKLRARVGVPELADPVAEFLALLSDLALQDKVAEQTREIRVALVRAALHEALPLPKIAS